MGNQNRVGNLQDSLSRGLLVHPPERLKAKEKRVTKDEMVGWCHRLNGHESEQIPGDREGEGSLVCCSSWGR